MTGEHDKQLLARIAGGDKEALRVLYDRHAPGLLRFVETRSIDRNDAADIVHDCMIDVWKSADRFGGRSTVKSWIYSIARNKSVDRNRKRGRTVLKEPDETVADDGLRPDEVVAAFQDAEGLRACISRLSEKHRTAIHLAFFEDLTYAEIAAMEGCPVGTIKTRIMHAKKQLFECVTKRQG